MLYTRKERETPLLHHLSPNLREQQQVLQSLLLLLSLAGMPLLHFFLFFAMPTAHTKLHVSCTTRSRTGSNELIPIQIVHLTPYNEDAAVQHEPQEASTATVHTPRRKIGLKKKLTPRKYVFATLARGASSKALADPSSPAENNRSKKQLLLE